MSYLRKPTVVLLGQTRYSRLEGLESVVHPAVEERVNALLGKK